MNLMPGMQIGNYQILGVLGTGGMGQVYRAKDTQLGRIVAIKFLSDVGIGSEGGIRRFITEAKAASALNHPNILTVYGIGEYEGKPYIAMEYIDGSTLRSIIQKGPVPLKRALDIARQTLAGLSKAHSIGIVHRDLKPENIMITHDGFVKILDFGLAKLLKDDSSDRTAGPLETVEHSVTKTGMIVGTAAYMSPEQARGQTADLRSDIFSLGIVLYEMVTGTNPFRRETTVDTISAILRDVPATIGTGPKTSPSALNTLLEKALQKIPENRFASAREMETALLEAQTQVNTMEHSDTIAYSTVQPATFQPAPAAPTIQKRQPFSKWIIAAAIVIALGGISIWFYRGEASKPRVSGSPVIAVMAFENKTADPELKQVDIGRVLADAFVQVLYDCKGVQVISPWRLDGAAVEFGRSYSDTAHDSNLIKKLTEQLNANVILSGSLSQIGETFVLNATLTDLWTGELLGNFRAQCNGKGEILSKLTKEISESLKSQLNAAGATVTGGRESKQLATGSLDAYAHMLRAKDFNNEGKWNEGVKELEKALQIDPNMGLAWAELACAYSFNGDDARSKAAHTKALELKPRLTRKEQAWLEGISAWLSGSGDEFRRSMESFMKEFPDERDAHFYIGLSWQWLDHDCHKALESYEIGYRLTPNYYPLTKSIVDCQLELNQEQKAIESLNRYIKVVRSGYGHQQAKTRLEKLKS